MLHTDNHEAWSSCLNTCPWNQPRSLHTDLIPHVYYPLVLVVAVHSYTMSTTTDKRLKPGVLTTDPAPNGRHVCRGLCRMKMLPVVGHAHGLCETLRVCVATANFALTLMKYTCMPTDIINMTITWRVKRSEQSYVLETVIHLRIFFFLPVQTNKHPSASIFCFTRP